MIRVNNVLDNPLVQVVAENGCFKILEYDRDLSVTPDSAITAYFAAEMDVKKRQLYCDLSRTKSGIILQAGEMQWMAGDVNVRTGVKGVGDFAKKMFTGMVTNETGVKPEYTGTGLMMTEPTYKHLLLLDVDEWGGHVVLDDGLFLACEASLALKITARSNLSSVVLGNEGLLNLSLKGSGICCLEAKCPMEELVLVELENDVLKIDGNFAIAWSAGLQFTVERTTPSLVGSAASGEGLVNVYRGTGKVLMMPLD